MWARNLLLWTIGCGALAALALSVFSSATPPPQAQLHDSIGPTLARLDAAFATDWLEQAVQPADPAPELAVARRISLALTGTIPSLEEIRHFESLPREGRLRTWLAKRLGDRRYADYVAERLARAFVGVEDGPFLLYRRRRFVAWLADQLAANVPYDRLVRHLIADVGLWTDTPATNFLSVTIQPEQQAGPDANRLAARVSRAFLGVRLDCAECHDHPFAPWTKRDFESLAAFFSRTRHSLRGIRDAWDDDATASDRQSVSCGVPFARELLGATGTRRQRLAEWVTHPGNRAFAREAANRAWALMFGRPLVEPIDNLDSANIGPALDILAEDFAASGFNWQRLLEIIASSRAFGLDSQRAPDDSPGDEADTAGRETHWAVFPLVRLRSEQVAGAVLQSGSLATINRGSHILVRLARQTREREFVLRYGNSPAEEFEIQAGTIPQRLLLMNGQVVHDMTKDDLLANAATQIAVLAPDDRTAIETAMLAVLTRRPSDDEARYFSGRLAGASGPERNRRVGDLCWSLLNTTEFSWNH